MAESESKQPQIPQPPKNPERVVRTYQSDLAKMSKEMEVPLEKEKSEKKKPEGLVTPAQKPEKKPKKERGEKVELETRPLEEELKRHYVEEIQATDTVEIRDEDILSKEELQPVAAATPSAPQPAAKQNAVIVTEEASSPKKGVVGSVFAWLMGGTGREEVVQDAPAQAPPQTFKTTAVIPKVTPPPKPPSAPPQKKVAPIPPQPAAKAPPVPEDLPIAPEPPKIPKPKQEEKPAPIEVPKVPDTPPAPTIRIPKPSQEISKNPLFAPPKEISQPEKRTIPTPAPEPIPVPPKPPEDLPIPSPITTYTSDARKGIAKRKETRLSVLAKEQDAKKLPPKKQQRSSPVPLVATAVVLIVLGIGALTVTAFFLNQETAPIATTPRVVTPVFAEDRVRVSASETPSLENTQEAFEAVPTPLPNTLTHITFASSGEIGQQTIPFSDILLQSENVPGIFARAVYPQSMLGVYGDQKEPVLILAVTSFERTFRSLLSWENTMPQTLEPVFGPLNETRIGTSTPPFIPVFIDEEVETTDTRILYDAQGSTHLIYGYVTPNILFVTKTKETFIELTERIVRE